MTNDMQVVWTLLFALIVTVILLAIYYIDGRK